MNYLWQSYAKDKKYYVSSAPLPGYEVEFEDKAESGLNPLGRFYDIFKEWLSDESFDEADKKEIENCLIHFLAHLDFDRGIHCTTIAESLLEAELMKGCYGEDIKNRYKQLSAAEQNDVLHCLRMQLESQNKENFFYQAVLKVFPGSRMYFYKYEKKFLLYLPYADGKDNCEKIQLLQDLFFDIRCDIEIFWNKHFGIIGKNYTMHMDKMILY